MEKEKKHDLNHLSVLVILFLYTWSCQTEINLGHFHEKANLLQTKRVKCTHLRAQDFVVFHLMIGSINFHL